MSLPQKELYNEDDYYSVPEGVRVELIDGRIYYQAASNRIHQKVLNVINNMIYNYTRSRNGLCEVYPAPFAVKLYEDRETIVEPDISVICDQEKLTDRGCNGAPDWIIEVVSPGNPENDYIRKLNLYKDAGVREYWFVNPGNKRYLCMFLKQVSLISGSILFKIRLKWVFLKICILILWNWI